MYKTIQFFCLLTLAFNFIKQNESMHRFKVHNDDDRLVRYMEGNVFGENAVKFMPETSSSSSNTRQLSTETFADQVSKMSAKFFEKSHEQGETAVMVGVDPAYFDNSDTKYTKADREFYMKELEMKVHNCPKEYCVKAMKFNPNVGVVTVKFNANSTKAEVNEVMTAMWEEENKVWFMEFDAPVQFKQSVVVKVDGDKYVQYGQFTAATHNNAASTMPSPFPTTNMACPNPAFTGTYNYSAPNDEFFRDQWGMENANGFDVDATAFWFAMGNQTGTTAVAVVDSGMETTMKDFEGQMWENPGETPNNGVDDDGNGFTDDYNGWDFHTNSSTITDHGTHGTQCAGVVAAKHNDSYGTAGMGKTAKVAAFPVVYISDSAAAIEYSTNMGFKVNSCSWGTGPTHYMAVYSAVKASNDAGQVYVNAVPNDASDSNTSPDYPTWYNFPNMVNVGSHDMNGYVSSFSDYGAPYVHVFAPGECMLTTYTTYFGMEFYAYSSGTSFATPMVAGMFADMFTAFPTMTAEQAKQAVMDSCYDTGKFTSQHAVCGGAVSAYTAYENAKTYYFPAA